jgi:uncharacterized RmlC-like cupin family protein
MVVRPSDGKSRVNKAGDFIYIKPGVPHEVFNMSTPARLRECGAQVQKHACGA